MHLVRRTDHFSKACPDQTNGRRRVSERCAKQGLAGGWTPSAFYCCAAGRNPTLLAALSVVWSTWLESALTPDATAVHTSQQMSHPPRQSVRVRLDAEVRLRRAVDRPHEVKLRDLSTHGCSVDLVNRVQAGDRLWVKLPGLESIEGFVCWAKEFHAGPSDRLYS